MGTQRQWRLNPAFWSSWRPCYIPGDSGGWHSAKRRRERKRTVCWESGWACPGESPHHFHSHSLGQNSARGPRLPLWAWLGNGLQLCAQEGPGLKKIEPASHRGTKTHREAAFIFSLKSVPSDSVWYPVSNPEPEILLLWMLHHTSHQVHLCPRSLTNICWLSTMFPATGPGKGDTMVKKTQSRLLRCSQSSVKNKT